MPNASSSPLLPRHLSLSRQTSWNVKLVSVAQFLFRKWPGVTPFLRIHHSPSFKTVWVGRYPCKWRWDLMSRKILHPSFHKTCRLHCMDQAMCCMNITYVKKFSIGIIVGINLHVKHAFIQKLSIPCATWRPRNSTVCRRGQLQDMHMYSSAMGKLRWEWNKKRSGVEILSDPIFISAHRMQVYICFLFIRAQFPFSPLKLMVSTWPGLRDVGKSPNSSFIILHPTSKSK